MTAIAMTLEECAEALQVSTRDISAEIHAGRLPALRIGRRFRVRRADFDAWQEAQVAAQTRLFAEPRLEILPPYRSGRKPNKNKENK